MTMQAMRCAEEAYGLYYYFDSSRELLCYSLPWVFFQRYFSLSGSSTGLLVAACGSCVSHLPRYITDWHLLLSIRFSRIKEGVAATQLPGRLFSQRLHFAMQSEWECGKVCFRPCISHVICYRSFDRSVELLIEDELLDLLDAIRKYSKSCQQQLYSRPSKLFRGSRTKCASSLTPSHVYAQLPCLVCA